MSNSNKHHHRKVKHTDSDKEPYNADSFKATASTATHPNSKSTSPEVETPKFTEEYTSAGQDPKTVVEETTHGKKISGNDSSLHMGDTTLQTPEEHKKDQQTDQSKTDKTEVAS